MVEQHLCNKCGAVIEGKVNAKTNKVKKFFLGTDMVPHKPWRIEMTNQIFNGWVFELCATCEREFRRSLKIPAEERD